MPGRPQPALTPCGTPGCPNLTTSWQCEPCALDARRASDARRPSARQRGYDREWEKTSAAYRAAHPVCEDPAGCTAPTKHVHHRDGRGPKGPRGHDWINLEGLCHEHHSQRTAREQPGGWAAGPTT